MDKLFSFFPFCSSLLLINFLQFLIQFKVNTNKLIHHFSFVDCYIHDCFENCCLGEPNLFQTIKLAPCPLGVWEKKKAKSNFSIFLSWGSLNFIIWHKKKSWKQPSNININCYEVGRIIMEWVEIEHHDRNEFGF